MKKVILGTAAAIVMALTFGWTGGGTADAGFTSLACPFYDNETPTECQITQAWVVGPGGVGVNDIPNPPVLPGPFVFNKTLRILGSGSIDASSSGGPGITLTIDGSQEVGVGLGGAFIMDPNATFVETNDVVPGNNQPAGPIVISATGGAQLAAGTQIRAQNTSVNGNGGAITMTLGASSSFAGLISSQELTGTDQARAGNITINVTGDLTLAAGSVINSQKNADSAVSGDIAITVSGDMIMKGGTPGALITSEHPSATNGTPGGNITIKVGTGDNGTFTMESGSRVDSSSLGFAGNIAITAGNKIDIQEGAEVRAGQPGLGTRRHGGRIFVIAGCEALIFGTLSSRGQDPGADLVHVEGCKVHIGPNALIESTGAAHDLGVGNSCDGIDDPAFDGFGNPLRGGDAGEVLRPDHPDNSTVCVEIWARHVIIDAGGEVNADFALGGGTQGHGWIDIFAEQDIIIAGPAVAPYAVHSNSGLGNDLGGDVRIKAKNSFITMSGLAVQANATLTGGDGGSVEIEAGGTIALGNASIQAKGAPSGGAVENGGTIDIRSYQGTLTGGPAPGELNTDAEVDGVVTLQSCLGTNYTGTVVGTLVTPADDCTVLTPTFPAYVAFNPGGRWDRCGESSISGRKFDLGGTPLQGWTIRLYGPGNVLLDTKVTLADGSYTFVVAGGGTYLICEVLQVDWIQETPMGPGAGLAPCTGPNEAPWGYIVTVNVNGSCCDGQDVTGKDFVNKKVIISGPPCEKLPVQTVLDPGAGKQYPGNKGPDYIVQVNNGESVQAAVDKAALANSATTGDINLDNYLIIMVKAHNDDSLGGSSTQNVVISAVYPKPFALIGCSVTLNDATPTDANATIKIACSANSTPIKIAEGAAATSNIFLMDLHGSKSNVAGVEVCGNNRYLRNEAAHANPGYGFKIVGNYNTMHNGSAGDKGKGNGLDGVYVSGNYNVLKDANAFANTGAGFNVIGNYNKLLKLDSGDRGKGNVGDGFRVAGFANILEENTATSNTGDGFDVSGGTSSALANKLKKNSSNGGSAGSDQENGGAEYRLLNYVKNDSGNNKADSITVPKAGAPTKCTTFPATNATANFAAANACE